MASSEEIIDDFLEAVAPPLPRESEEAPPAIIEEEEQPPRSSVFGRRRKTVLAVVSALLAVAVGVAAVGLSANPSESPSAADQGAAMQNDQDAVVVADGPSDGESSADPPEEHEELDSKVLDVDYHDADHPEDVINDVGYEQGPEFLDNIDETVHETTEEKVPFNSEDYFAIEISDFEGGKSIRGTVEIGCHDGRLSLGNVLGTQGRPGRCSSNGSAGG